MKTKIIIFSILCLVFSTYSDEIQTKTNFYKAVHLLAPYPPKDLSVVERAIKDVFVPARVNMIIFEINYRYQWKSHPELSDGDAFSEEQIKGLAELCFQNKIRLVPLFNCLGHQSWSSHNSPLIEKYSQFDETPNLPKNNPGIYCRSWCPSNPDLLPVVKDLLKELKGAFNSDAIHVGMDEVFVIADKDCPRCKGKDTAELFAKAVNDLHKILKNDLNVEMMMWGDRLLDDSVMKYGKWESSQNGTSRAIDNVPRDIIVCDWHYELRATYPSVDFFISKGFRVLPSWWKNEKAAVAFLNYSEKYRTNSNLIGYLTTTWVNSANYSRALLGEQDKSEQVNEVATTTKVILKAIK